MSTENGNGRITWRGIGIGLLALVQVLVGTLYAKSQSDIKELQAARVTDSQRLATLEAVVQSIDRRTVRIENKLDEALDRNPYTGRPGPR